MPEDLQLDILNPQYDAAEVGHSFGRLTTAIRAVNELRVQDKEYSVKKNDQILKRIETVEKSLTEQIEAAKKSLTEQIEAAEKSLTALTAMKAELSIDRISELRVRLNEFQISESSARESRSQQIEASFGAGMTSLEQRLSNASQQRHAALENRINETKFSLENRANEIKFGVEAKISELKGGSMPRLRGRLSKVLYGVWVYVAQLLLSYLVL